MAGEYPEIEKIISNTDYILWRKKRAYDKDYSGYSKEYFKGYVKGYEDCLNEIRNNIRKLIEQGGGH